MSPNRCCVVTATNSTVGTVPCVIALSCVWCLAAAACLTDELRTPRRHSLGAISNSSLLHGNPGEQRATPPASPPPPPLAHASPRNSFGASLATAAGTAAESWGVAAACSSSSGGCSSSASDTCKRHWPPPAPAAGPLLAGEHLQSQTHAALQQLAVKQTGGRSERLGVDSPLLGAAEGQLQHLPSSRATDYTGPCEPQEQHAGSLVQTGTCC